MSMGGIYTRIYTATVSGKRVVPATCEKCNTNFSYEMTRCGIGRSLAAAQKDLEKRLLHDQDMVACPRCYWVNEAMIESYRRRRYDTGQIIAWAGLITLPFCLGLMALVDFHLRKRAITDRQLGVYGAIAIGVFFVSLTVSTLAMRLSRARVDPNATYPLQPVLPPGSPVAMIQG
jgi:hypothetical protein